MKLISMLLLSALPLSVWAQTKTDNKKWDVSNPDGPYKDVSFTVNEGTWMNLDISPDGKEIIFDLLGDIYSIPAAGVRQSYYEADMHLKYSHGLVPTVKNIFYFRCRWWR
ncbi:hypothetical protein [Niabella hibiscisoli]|uniref:hypothetical protein n=1 Tax=Niabella hibiscisoli TaxID=1825928 RepID=UPI001F0F79B7|nr:hypothetical protein [Niabella hibiscisoli]MCH5720450.1 hypothetical protein [Niabella hibiscisoli]